MSATLGGILRIVAVAVPFARSRPCDPTGAQARCEGRRINTKQLGGAALAINATIGPLQRLHQIRTVALTTVALCQNDVRYVGRRGRIPRQVRACDVEAIRL